MSENQFASGPWVGFYNYGPGDRHPWTSTCISLMDRSMEENQLEAFSDGVLAIIITIMVLELIVASNGC
jgi:hypothetical protein